MEDGKGVKNGNSLTVFDVYGEKITAAYDQAVRDALIKHRRLGNYVVVEKDGEIVKLRGEQIDELLK